MDPLYLWLAGLHPIVPWLGISLGCFLVCWHTRRHLPELWVILELVGPSSATASKILLAMPSVIIGGAFTSIMTGGDMNMVVLGSISALLAPLAHHLMKGSPLPYRGGLGKYRRPPGPPTTPTLLAFITVAVLIGCSSGLDPAVEPERAHCHIQARHDADTLWEKTCQSRSWDECPQAQEMSDGLSQALSKCDDKAYPQ